MYRIPEGYFWGRKPIPRVGKSDHLRRATGLSMFGLLATEAGAMAGSTVRALRG